MAQPDTSVRTFTHWGAYDVGVAEGRIVAVTPFEGDPDPSPIGQSLVDGIDHPSRVRGPAVRKGWLERGPHNHGGGRGAEPFVEVSWDEALTLAANELDRVRNQHGNTAIFGGSYGWASAGRFHHAQSQIHRFLNQLGGYTASVNSYSTGAAQVIIPHVLGRGFLDILDAATTWPVIAESSELVVAFGGIPLKNSQVNSGGIGRHVTRGWLQTCRDRGVEFVNISPLGDDIDTSLEPTWLAVRPNTDTALMLGMAHTLLSEGLHDEAFLSRYCTGFERFRPYLTGEADGQAKDAQWAAGICGIPAADIAQLARRMARHRTMITIAWSLQRSDHGEQPYWMATVLAAMLGQIGLPGGGIGYGYAAEAGVGNPVRRLSGPSLDQGQNNADSFIPVARIADMLLHPGATYDYNGQKRTYPDTRLVYWCGGNPFHHHQDLNRLVRAWQQPETVIVHEPWWNAVARHADIVFPATTSLERNDIGRASNDDWVFPMHGAVDPIGDSRSDFEIFSGLAAKLGTGSRFTEDRDEAEWLCYLYDDLRKQAAAEHIDLPEFAEFWDGDGEQLPLDDSKRVLFAEFRTDPEENRLGTPSGLIEIFSKTIDSFGYPDCPGHPVWLEPAEWLGAPAEYPLHLVSNQPVTRLHSQLDCGRTSQQAKVNDREPVLLHPDDAAQRGITEGDIVRVFNGRGACLAGATLSDSVMP
ncbi:MAG: molybdopterin-dependent oxidoreductase, partial [Acidimicrobiales bacterium]